MKKEDTQIDKNIEKEAVENTIEESIIPEELQRIAELETALETSIQKVEALEIEKKELEDKILRTSADVQNMKRRSVSETAKARLAGSVKVLTPVITVVDTFQRAFDHLPEDLQDHEFIKGIQAVEKNFSETLTSLEVEFFGEAGENFDASLHDSMMVSADAKAGTIAQVFEKGVKMGNEIIRHAKVSVGQA